MNFSVFFGFKLFKNVETKEVSTETFHSFESDTKMLDEKIAYLLSLALNEPMFVSGNNLYVYLVHNYHQAYDCDGNFLDRNTGKKLPISCEQLDMKKVAYEMCETSSFVNICRSVIFKDIKKTSFK